MIRGGTTVHKRLRDDRQTRVHDVRLMYIEDKVRVFDKIHPKPERKRVTLPCMNHFGIRYAVLQRLIVHEIEHVFDREGEGRSPMGSAKDCFEKVVHEFLKGTLRR